MHSKSQGATLIIVVIVISLIGGFISNMLTELLLQQEIVRNLEVTNNPEDS